MSWRLAYSLDTLRNQVNNAYPSRSKASDGTIGDSSHAAVPSDHNPNSLGVVTAMDLTHDPAHGFDAHKTADLLRTNRHPNLKYLISNRRIAGDWTGWNWQTYNGSNPHDKHIHISVGVGNDGQSRQPYDDRTAWYIKEGDKMTQSEAEKIVTYLYRLGTKDYPTPGQGAYWVPRVKDVKTGLDELGEAMLKAQTPAEYVPVTEQLYRKKG